MPSLRQIRQRIKSVQNSKQIMRAMQLVSASKLKRTQIRLAQARSVLDFLDGLLERVLVSIPEMIHPLCVVREGKPSLLVVFTSDAGLCGSYNTQLIQLAESYLRRESAHTTELVFVGKKGYRYFTKRGYSATEAFLDLAGRPSVARAQGIGKALIVRFLSGHVGSIALLYSSLVSSTVHRPTIVPWLPVTFGSQHTERQRTAYSVQRTEQALVRERRATSGFAARRASDERRITSDERRFASDEPSASLGFPRLPSASLGFAARRAPRGERREASAARPAASPLGERAPRGERREGKAELEYIFEPSVKQVFEDLLPRFALAKFQCLMLEAFTSEHSARMIAMKSATDNAEALLKALTIQRNKIRQAVITKELSEIVGTVEALK